MEPDDLGRFPQEDAEAHVKNGFSQFTLGFTVPEWCLDTDAVRHWRARRGVANDAAVTHWGAALDNGNRI